MNTWQRRALYSAVSLGLLILGYAVVYDYGMATFEGEPTTFLHSLQVVVETFTTTGFGSDAGWTSPAMNVIVIVMDLTGVALIFLTLPAIVFPLLEETVSTSAPTRADLDAGIGAAGESIEPGGVLDGAGDRKRGLPHHAAKRTSRGIGGPPTGGRAFDVPVGSFVGAGRRAIHGHARGRPRTDRSGRRGALRPHLRWRRAGARTRRPRRRQ